MSAKEHNQEGFGLAVGKYLAHGPSVPPESLSATNLEELRSVLIPSQDADYRGTTGWIAVEQAFAASNQASQARATATPEACLTAAGQDFDTALGLYFNPGIDELVLPWRVKLARASLGLYRNWVEQGPPNKDLVVDFEDQVATLGATLLDQQPQDTQSKLPGVVGEYVTLLAYARRQKSGPPEGGNPGFAVPSTMRQSRSRDAVEPGASSGSGRDKSRLRHNWNLSVVEHDEQGWKLAKKLQVKNRINRREQDYGPDITVIELEADICPDIRWKLGVAEMTAWDLLSLLVEARGPGKVPTKTKRAATAISSLFYEQIEAAART